ncbi:N-acetyltransferase [Sphingomonas crocodyli]|uniref:N-acetyltransferase n=1 Tax=Sphingomonas crocodyli TaxID=1979270 RepID=A0A437M6R4_9SPHN|nr:N-acetyltransferase [Sphingomonas crocodyli]RVT93339.1 N-acetyltransferase [Sphingomonas crocodyli]
MPLNIRPISTKADRKRFVEVEFALNAADPNWVPPLRMEALELVTPGKNPFYEHADQQLFLAERDGKAVGRISAHIDRLILTMPPEQGGGPGIGQWGMLEAESEAVAHALIRAAEDWLRGMNMTSVMAPISNSMWEKPGLLVQGHDHPPTVEMGHNNPAYQGWIEALGYGGIKDLLTYDLDIVRDFPPLVQRIVQSGERNARIRIRRVDKSKFDEEAALILSILNDAWSDNWGFVPITPSEIEHTGKKLKPIVFEDLIRVAEVDGEPVAFMMTWPDLNELTRDLNGRLFPFGWIKLLKRLRRPQVRTMRVPLMGVVKKLQATRLASQLAFMMIEYIRRDAVANFGASRGEIGWVLEDNQGMRSIAETIDSKVNKVYRIYAKPL